MLESGIAQLDYTYAFGDTQQHTITAEQVFDADPAGECSVWPRRPADQADMAAEAIGQGLRNTGTPVG